MRPFTNNNLCKQTILKLVAYLITGILNQVIWAKCCFTAKVLHFSKSENFQLYKTCEKDDGAIAIST